MREYNWLYEANNKHIMISKKNLLLMFRLDFFTKN